MSAQQVLPLTSTPLCLLHDYEEVSSVVEVSARELEAARFDVAPTGRPQDPMLSCALTPGLLRIELHEPERLILDTRLDVERRLPPIVIAVRHGAAVEPIRLLGRADGEQLRGPVWVRRSGTPRDLVVAIGAERAAAFALERDYCELSWSVGSRPRSLRFTAAYAGAQVILRPSRRD